jgi:hypothetical protein
MADKNAARALAQTRVAPHADNWGAEWDAEDVEFLQAFADALPEDLALALGRTVYAVNGARQALREGRLGGGSDRNRAQHMRALQAQPWASDDPRWG